MWPETIKIFILDDFESIRTMLKAHIKAMGHKGQIFEASNVKNAKALLQQAVAKKVKIDFILSDWNLPDGNGLDFLKFTKTLPEFKDTPFLMVTTENETTKIIQALGLGASNYLIKPWTPAELKEKMLTAWFKHHPNTAPTAKKKIALRKRTVV